MSSETAPIIAAQPGQIHFRVDAVTPAADPLPVQSLRSKLEQMLEGTILASSADDETHILAVPLKVYAAPVQLNPLLTAIHYAFSDHRPLILDPDAIWLTIAQGFAQHINLHHEALRDRLVRHTEKRTLTVVRTSLHGAAEWAETVEEWARLIANEVGEGLRRVLTCDFSTSTPVARTVSQIVLMNTFQRYFDYRELTICGIPTVTLTGTPDDWQRIRERIEVLAEYDLEWWVARLRPICDALVQTAAGQPPLSFWQAIYKPEAAYGGDVVTGWVADLFPYLNDPIRRAPTLQNPILLRPRSTLTANEGLAIDQFPAGICEVMCHLDELDGSSTPTRLIGGLVGVRQLNEGELAVVPGWAVGTVDPFTALLDHLELHGERAAPIEWSRQRSIVELPKEALQLLATFHGTTLFAGTGHSWRVREVNEVDRYEVVEPNEHVAVFMDLDDGRVVGTCWRSLFSSNAFDRIFKRSTGLWVVVGWPRADTRERYRTERPVLLVDETLVIAKSFKAFVKRVLAAHGAYYFDAPGFTPDAVFERH